MNRHTHPKEKAIYTKRSLQNQHLHVHASTYKSVSRSVLQRSTDTRSCISPYIHIPFERVIAMLPKKKNKQKKQNAQAPPPKTQSAFKKKKSTSTTGRKKKDHNIPVKIYSIPRARERNKSLSGTAKMNAHYYCLYPSASRRIEETKTKHSP